VSRIGAAELRDAVLDPVRSAAGTARPRPSPPTPSTPPNWRARAATGLDEAVLTGEGTVFGRRVAVACEFDFLAGSIGVAAAERITAAVERATAEGLPLLASPSSGGTRMQEGTVAFLQMVKIAAAVTLHKQAHLPYLVYLRHPTTGGVFASWGSLGHVTVAEPGRSSVSSGRGSTSSSTASRSARRADRREPARPRRHRRRGAAQPPAHPGPALRVVADPPGEPPAADRPSRCRTSPPGCR
jgi:acetyl-CoA carboxylase beta subunit